MVITVVLVLLCKSGVYVSNVVVVEDEKDEEVNLVDSLVQVVLCESKVEVVVDVLDGVSDSLNGWDGDAVLEIDVDKDVIMEDGKLDRDVIPGEAVIGGELDTVDILPAVDLRVVGLRIVTGFSGVFGFNIVDELCLLVEV